MVFKSNPFRQLLFILLFWAYPLSLWAVTPSIPAQPAEYVVDLAGVLDYSTRTSLNARLKELEAKTTVQVVVLTLNSLEGEPIEDFSHQTAVKWRIGQKGKDNGVLLTVAVKDHKYRIEVGYGLEGVLPDSLVGSLGREYLVPNFRKGDFAAGIMAAVSQIINKIAAGQGVEISGAEPAKPARPSHERGSPFFSLLTPILIIIFAFLVLINIFFRRRRVGPGGFWYFGGGGGGGSWGGGDSGFSGGGGDFGGGGASGDW